MALTRRQREKKYIAQVRRLSKQGIVLNNRTISDSISILKGLKKDVQASIIGAARWEVGYLPTLKAEIDRQIIEFGRKLINGMRNRQSEAWYLGQKMVDDPLEAIGITTAIPMLSDAQLIALQTNTGEMITWVGDDTRKKISHTLNTVIMGEKTPYEAMKRMESDVFKIATKRGVNYQVERIARTEVNRSFGLANQLRNKQTAEKIPEMRKYWLTAGDEHVRQTHRIAGSEYAPGGRTGPIEVDEKYIVGEFEGLFPGDPALGHEAINCRCQSIPWMEEFEG